ncbi:MAG: hypothetical protein LQ343_007946 [Gyalolechia ehrenbergii]|nr:MAG: hypothetical protein LQ343_007946 [Gyalolechia ehrenbergii]
MSPPSHLRILCFGASITAGFHSFGLAHHPYAKRLTHRLQTSLPSTKIDVEIDALPGDRVIGGRYLERLTPHLHSTISTGPASAKAATPRYDWIILQAGGNDLSNEQTPQATYTALQTLWRLCLSNGITVLALAVTETSHHQNPRTRARYEELNAWIKAHEEEGFFVADVCTAVPWVGMEEGERRRVWDDGLHLRPRGYDMLGDAVAERLLEVVEAGRVRGKL